MKTEVPQKARFVAEYLDGFVYEQNPLDVHPNSRKGSSYTYALELVEEHGGMSKLSLQRYDNTLTVDLQTGEMDLNGHRILLDYVELPPNAGLLEPVYSRRMRIVLSAGSVRTPPPEIMHYEIGWKTVVDEKEYSRILIVRKPFIMGRELKHGISG